MCVVVRVCVQPSSEHTDGINVCSFNRIKFSLFTSLTLSKTDLVISQLYGVYTTHVWACVGLRSRHVCHVPVRRIRMTAVNSDSLLFFFLKFLKEAEPDAGKNIFPTLTEIFDLTEVWLTGTTGSAFLLVYHPQV